MIMIRPSDKVYIEISSSFDRFDNFIKNITISKWAKTYKNLTNIVDHRNKHEKNDWQPLTRWQNKSFSTKPTSSRRKLHISNYTFQNSHIHLNSNLKFFFIAINRNLPNQKKVKRN